MHSMNYIGRFLSNFKEFYNDINAATLTGAIDVIVVEQPDGTFSCSPFHVRFGKLGVLRSREKVVDIEINGESHDIHMKLGESGEAFFVEELEEHENEDIPEHLATSPIPTAPMDLLDGIDDDGCVNKSNDVDAGQMSVTPLSIENNRNTPTTPVKEESAGVMKAAEEQQKCGTNKKKKRRTKKKNEPRKSISLNQLSLSAIEMGADRKNETASEQSVSTDSSSSDPELKDISSYTSNPTSTPRKILDPDFHFFSDTDVPSSSTTGDMRRTDSQMQIASIQSDSEVEVQTRKAENPNSKQQSWEWGGFPSVTPTTTTTPSKPLGGDNGGSGGGRGGQDDSGGGKTNDQSMISNMFSFMKRSHEQNDGIYLSDLNSVDPEVAALYFNQRDNRHIDMDCESSGNGTSLAQSPNSAEGCKSIDSDFDYHIKGSKSDTNDVALSLCGWDVEQLSSSRFDEYSLSFTDFCNNPMIVEDPNLVVAIKGKYYNWRAAAPILASVVVFQRPLLQSSVEQLCNFYMPMATASTSNEQKQKRGAEVTPTTAVTSRPSASSSSWWTWGRSKAASQEITFASDMAGMPLNSEPGGEQSKDHTVVDVLPTSSTVADGSTAIPAAVSVLIPNHNKSTTEDTMVVSQADTLHGSKTSNVSGSSTGEKYRKTLRLSSEQIVSLQLRDGMNEVEFSVTTAYQGTTRCRCHLYKWRWDDKIVISDIDGTITKSDVLGHILPIVGKDWAQSGVAQLFNNISNNGYKLLYLSARAIGQARGTRDYLRSIRQGDLTMPDGPILLNPTSLITAFHCEVIEKKPEQFKISCMSDIKALFPSGTEPFYAGYGNRINDGYAYRAVGIPTERIFTINPKGELKHELTKTFHSSYLRLSELVDGVFPPNKNKPDI